MKNLTLFNFIYGKIVVYAYVMLKIQIRKKIVGGNMLFIEYPKCSTSNKAKKWLNDNDISYDQRNIKEDNPTFEELKYWIQESGMEIKKFFNTSGKLYREQGIKDIMNTATQDELITILASDGMMVKRPILIGANFILTGFKEDIWKSIVL